VVADQWRGLGLGVEEQVVPPQRTNDGEFVAAFPAFDLVPQPNDLGGISLLHSRFARVPDNNFRGSNFNRLMDPQFDALIDRWLVTIPRTERMQALGQILYEISDRLNEMPLVYGVRPIEISTRMQNVGVGTAVDSSQAWNVHLWDVK
jgi:hypothetical protein